MPTCQAKDKNTPCKEPAVKNSKYCGKHQGYERPIKSKTDTGMGQGDTKDKKTGKSQVHRMGPMGH